MTVSAHDKDAGFFLTPKHMVPAVLYSALSMYNELNKKFKTRMYSSLNNLQHRL
jgi:hypothetical protein